MSARDRFITTLSPGVLLILILCACSVAVHFIAEGVAPSSNRQGLDLVAQEVCSEADHEHSEDHFLFPILTEAPAEFSALIVISTLTSRAFSFSLCPQLPPPNC